MTSTIWPDRFSTQMLANDLNANEDAYRFPVGSTAMPSGMGQTAARFGPKLVTTPIAGCLANAGCGASRAAITTSDPMRRRMTIPPATHTTLPTFQPF